ncbi:MAG: family transporter [Acidobacteria bacterium]|nr:family transporter [Acidobacteriota bacterium]
MIHLLALLGILSISFSAVFVRLAAVSPVTATFFRGAYAAPVLLAVWLAQKSGDRRGARERWLAVVSGLLLAIDLNLWHESIALLGAGLGTVIANVQVVFVAAAAWVLYGERPTPIRMMTIAAVLGGVVLTSGLARHDAYGTRPVAGAVIGLLAGVIYAAFLMVYRDANETPGPRSGPLLDSTAGMIAGALACAVFDPHFTMTPSVTANMWLVLLAIGSQVIGWLLIGTALPKLPVVETSVLLLGQPVFTVIWGVLWFDERLSVLQWTGAAIVLAGVAVLSFQRK